VSIRPNSFNVYIPLATTVELSKRARERIRDKMAYLSIRGQIPGVVHHDVRVAYEHLNGLAPQRPSFAASFPDPATAEHFLYHCADNTPVSCWFDVLFYRLPMDFPPFKESPLPAAHAFLAHHLRAAIVREVALIADTPKANRTRAYRRGSGAAPSAPERWTLEFTGSTALATRLLRQVPFAPSYGERPVLTKKEQIK